MSKKMLIDATHPEETRVVVVDGNRVEEFDFESENRRQLAGNIYLAKVTRVEASLQAAFVEYGGNRHGFLAFAEIHPDYYQIPVADREALLAEEEAEARAEAARAEASRGGRRAPDEAASLEGDDARDDDREDAGAADAEGPADAEEPTEAGGAAMAQDAPGGAIVTGDPRSGADGREADGADPDGLDPDGLDPDGADPDGAERDLLDGAGPEGGEIRGMETLDGDGSDGGLVEDTPESVPSGRSGGRSGGRSRGRGARAAAERDPEIEEVTEDEADLAPRPRSRPRRYKIQEVVKVRQIMLVQVVKEERGNKGAALTTYLSLAGRYCVLMPNSARGGGISRKITNAADRKKLKEIASEIEVPRGAGLIVRTAGAKRTKTEIRRDYEYLQRLWEQIRELTLKSIAPAKIYEEGDLIKRSIRDLYSREIDEVVVEGEQGYRTARDFMAMIMPSHAQNVTRYHDPMPLFARHQVESYLAGMFNPTVQLRSGGYIVIGVTEALVAIDVNSGRATKQASIEETALATNLEAADEVARQVKLRDLAGLIVVDFIDMDDRRNNAAVEKRMKDALKTDRARIQVGRISGFGLMEMSRQRMRPGMIEATTQPCPACHGTGLVRSEESLALTIVRQVEEEGVRGRSKEVQVRAPVGVVNFLFNHKREHLAAIEARTGMAVRLEADAHLVSPDFSIEKSRVQTRTVEAIAAPVVKGDASLMDDLDEAALAEDERAEAHADAAGAEARAREEAEDEADEAEAAGPPSDGPAPDAGDEDDAPRKKRRRRRRRRSGGRGEEAADARAGEGDGEEGAERSDAGPSDGASPPGEPGEGEASDGRRTVTRRRRSRSPAVEAAPARAVEGARTQEPEPKPEAEPAHEPAEALGEPVSDEVAAREEDAPGDGAAPEDAEAVREDAAEPAPVPFFVPAARRGAEVEAEAGASRDEAPLETKSAWPSAPAEEAPEEPAAAEGEEGASFDGAPVDGADRPVEDDEAAYRPVEDDAAASGESAPSDGADRRAEPEPAEARDEAPEPAMAEEAPPKPKRRGWWSLGR